MKNTTPILALAAAGALVLTACGGGQGFDDNAGEAADGSKAPASAEGPASLRMLIGSSGDAETNAVKEAAAAWAKESGNSVEVTVASDLNQELAQGFAGGSPADVFYLDAQSVADNAKAGNLYAYESDENADFYESLRNSFTYDGKQWCAPKDFSTLALVINTTMWQEAGLTDDDIPTTYDELADVARKLTTDEHVGLVLGPGIDRAGAFVVGSGGWWLNEDGTAATADTPEVLGGLQYVQDLIKDGSAAMSSDVGAGWGGEAFGTGKGAMTVEGNWIKGAIANDYPDLDYKVVEMPAGPAGPGTLLFTVCWGVAADSPSQAQAVDLVNYLTTTEQQMKFAEAFGVMPSRQGATEDYKAAFPEDAAFIAGGDYGHGPISAPGIKPVVDDLNSKLENFADVDLKAALESFDSNAASVLGQ